MIFYAQYLEYHLYQVLFRFMFVLCGDMIISFITSDEYNMLIINYLELELFSEFIDIATKIYV